MKRRLFSFLLALLCIPACSLASSPFSACRVSFPPDEKYAVYSGPGEAYVRFADGNAQVSTNDWIDVFGYDTLGFDETYLMIQYALSDSQKRIGYISAEEAGYYEGVPDLGFLWQWDWMCACRDLEITDDPFGSAHRAATLPKGTEVKLLCLVDSWAYVDTSPSQAAPMRGFVPADGLSSCTPPYPEVPAFVSATEFLSQAGIEYTVTGMNDNDLYFSLKNGGKASYYCYSDGYSVYEMGNWRFEEASNEDIARFLDANLEILCTVEAGLAPEEHLKKDYHAAEELGLHNINATVSNGLLDLSSLDRQGLDILLTQLSRHDGNDALNSMRARLASRMLGKLDITPVDPSQGCAWYDALTLSVQDTLPAVDASVYVEDPLLAQVTQTLIAYFDEEKRSWDDWPDADGEKTRNLVSLSVLKMEENNDRLILWANVSESQFALYDGCRAQSLSGSWIPCRITMVKNDQGLWGLEELLRAEDGTRYAPSILAFCNNDQKLANAMMQDEARDLWQCFETYLRANGYGDVEKIPY